jgi:hypothetical protein
MTLGGWIFFIFTWGIIISLVIFSYRRVLGNNEEANNGFPDKAGQ